MTTTHTFIQANGTTTQCARFMQGPALRHGYEWYNTDDSTWVERVSQPCVDVNDTRIFGYDRKEFLGRQYK
jgi:hypothetical protein